MSEKTRFVQIVCVVVSLGIIVQLTGCGYFLYPERRGQRPYGRIDPAIVVLDALGLFLFIVPGVIAFAVDITNGTLYRPGGYPHSSVPIEKAHLKVIRVNPNKLNKKRIKEIVKNHRGVPILFDQKNLEIYKLDRSENIEARLVELKKSGYRKN